jgi:hypothetical protein
MGYMDVMFGGDAKYYYIMQYVVLGSCVLFFFVNPWTILMMIAMELFAFQYYMIRKESNLKNRHDGERHCDTFTIREKEHREDKIFSFRDHEELKLFTQAAREIEQTREFKDHEVYVLNLWRKEQEKIAQELGVPIGELDDHLLYASKQLPAITIKKLIDSQTKAREKPKEDSKDKQKQKMTDGEIIDKRDNKKKKTEDIIDVTKDIPKEDATTS